jgi:septum formation protein
MGEERPRAAEFLDPGVRARAHAEHAIAPLVMRRPTHRRSGSHRPREGHLGGRHRLRLENPSEGECGRGAECFHDAVSRDAERPIITSRAPRFKARGYDDDMRLVLASASPRRRELLAAAGVPFHVDPVDADERVLAGETPAQYVERVARAKAELGRARHPEDVVLGADTTVTIDDQILAKPEDGPDAVRMLSMLAARPHDVLTAVALAWSGGVVSHVERTRVWFAPMSPADIRWYVESGEPMDRAGAYAIQGLASRFVTRIEGSYPNVVGLPVAAVLQMLTSVGFELPGVARAGAASG